MSGQERTINEIALQIGRMEATQIAQAENIGRLAASIDRLVEKLDKSDDVAREALEKSKSAHRRLNGHSKVLFWAGTTVIATQIGIILTLWKG